MKSKLNLTALLLLIMLLMSQVTYAGYSNNTRSKCRFLAKRFASNCHIAIIGLLPLCSQHQGHCESTNVSCTKAGFNGCTNSVGASNGWGGPTGFANICSGFGGANYSDMDQRLLQTGGNDLDNSSNRAALLPTFKGKLTSISNISINLSSYSGSALTNDFNLIVWKPVGESDDETPTKDKIIESGRVILKGGKLTFEGTLFKSSDFLVATRGTTTTVTYIGGNKTVTLPSNSEEVDYYVTMSGDVKDDTKVIVREAEEKANTLELTKELVIFPNPTANFVIVSLFTNDNSSLEYEIFDLEGKSVIANKQMKVEKNSKQTFQVDFNKLQSGNYYLLIINGDDKIIKSISKI
jgi:Secretion system C-terminal sorting domain